MVNFLTKIKEFDFYLKYSECSSHSHNLFGEIWRKKRIKNGRKKAPLKRKKSWKRKRKKKKFCEEMMNSTRRYCSRAPTRACSARARLNKNGARFAPRVIRSPVSPVHVSDLSIQAIGLCLGM